MSWLAPFSPTCVPNMYAYTINREASGIILVCIYDHEKNDISFSVRLKYLGFFSRIMSARRRQLWFAVLRFARWRSFCVMYFPFYNSNLLVSSSFILLSCLGTYLSWLLPVPSSPRAKNSHDLRLTSFPSQAMLTRCYKLPKCTILTRIQVWPER